MIKRIENNEEKQTITRSILEDLTEWFELEDGREEYIKNCINYIIFANYENNKPNGIICLKETSKDTLELALMGIKKEYHRQGIGTKLFNEAKQYAKENNYSFIQVKTVQMGYYKEYDETNKFYISLGFKELEVIKSIWDENNPCQIYIMYIK